MSRTLLDVPQVRDYLERHFLLRVETTEPRIALTFDDGPSPRNTPRLLDLLAGKGIPATFFVLGRYVRRFPHVVKRAADEGHELASHGTWHLPLPLLPDAVIRRDIETTGRMLEKLLGTRPRYFRPPMGWFNGRVLRVIERLGYQPVIGSVYPKDSDRPGADAIVDRVLRRVGPGDIVILHDSGWSSRSNGDQTLEEVDRLTDILGERGYRFDTLTALVAAGKGTGVRRKPNTPASEEHRPSDERDASEEHDASEGPETPGR